MLTERSTRRLALPALAVGLCALAVGCAQQVGDIDRTFPNKVKKSELEGEWYFRQTIADVPATNAFFFTGLSTGLEKLRFEITEGALIGYRSYELVPGSDAGADAQGIGDTRVEGCAQAQDPSLSPDERAQAEADCEFYGEGFNDDDYKGSPIVSYRIESHFDVQRQYNTATGEQSNVLIENTNDRYWNAREYMRVDWGANQLSNIFLFDTDTSIQYQHWIGDENPERQQIKREYDDAGNLVYMEFTTRAIIQPSVACFYLALADCSPTEIEIVSSFARAPEKKTYEAVEYDNLDMQKFGYFRTERLTYDRKRGLRRTGQIFLPNRHNIWETAYDEDGNLIPLKERTPKPVVYYMNHEMPTELDPYNKGIEEDWDRAFRRSAAAAQGKTPDQIGQMFVVCHNPVSADDHEACGEEGKVVNIGDVRYNHLYWVDAPQLAGPLGYGPSAADPETGEIISGTAYVYGGAVDTYATSSLDIVKLAIACKDGDDTDACKEQTAIITNGSDVRAQIAANLNPAFDPRASAKVRAPELKNVPIPTNLVEMMDPELRTRFESARDNKLPWDPGYEARQTRRIKENGFDLALLDETMVRDLTGGRYSNVAELPADELERIRPANWLTASRVKELEEFKVRHYSMNNVEHKDFFDDVVVGLALNLAKKYADQPEAARDEAIWQELRGLIYRGVTAHEVGHTLGLRHNFQGSYDSLNYFDEYWKLRESSLKPYQRCEAEGVDREDCGVQFVSDLYEVSAQTQAQLEGKVMDADGNVVEELPAGIAEYGYSSIMDYGLQFNTDFRGIGKYDEAAIIYAYTGGYDGRKDETGKLIADKGYVEVWNDDAFRTVDPNVEVDVKDVFKQLDFRQSLVYTHPLEGFHYTTIANGFTSVEDISTNRRLVKFDEIRAAREAEDAERPVEVPYMFCTDDWVAVDSSCHRWDHGADPFEQARYVINSYHNYYWFSNFARDNYEYEPFNKINRTYSRYLSYLTNIYQQIFFGGDYDNLQGTYRWLAANAGFNLVAEILETPNYGNHVTDKDGVLVHCFDATSEEFEEDGVMTTTADKCNNEDYDLEVPMGVGRYPFTRFDFNSGYEYYRYPTEAGHFYDYLAAILALTNSQAVVRGIDVQTDFLSYSLPYYIVFDRQLDDLVGSIWTETPQDWGPVVQRTEQGDVTAFRPLALVQFGNGDFDPLTGAQVDTDSHIPVDMMANSTPIRPYHSWSQRLFPLLYGMANFSSNLSLQFADNNYIFRVGNGEEVEPGDRFELVTCSDPNLGHTYGAIYNPSLARQTTAYKLVKRCQDTVDAYWRARREEFNVEKAGALLQDIENQVSYFNLMRSYYNVFGTL